MLNDDWSHTLRGKIREFRAISTNPHQKTHDTDEFTLRRNKQIYEQDVLTRVFQKATESFTPYLSRRLLEAQDQECRILNEFKHKDITESMNKKNCSIEEQLGRFLDKQKFEEERDLKQKIVVRQNYPELNTFARTIRSKVVGLIQKSQMETAELERKKKKEEENSQEREWLDSLLEAEQEHECEQRIRDYQKKQKFAQSIHDQVELKTQQFCSDFEKEQKRCKMVIDKELEEIKQEEEKALKKKKLLQADYLNELETRKKVIQDSKNREMEYFLKTDLERKQLEELREQRKTNEKAKIIANSKIQDNAANRLIELQNAEYNSLANRATRAAEELEIDKHICSSGLETDEWFGEPFKRVKKQAELRKTLDEIAKIRKLKKEEEQKADQESTRRYLEAGIKNDEDLKKKEKMRKDAELKRGECLRNQIIDREERAKEEKRTDQEESRKIRAAEKLMEQESELEKKKLLDEFALWRANIYLPDKDESAKLKCESDIKRDAEIRANNVTTWETENQENFGRWHPEKPYHPLLKKNTN